MPSITITEVNNTFGGLADSSNFTVFVPGFLGTPSASDYLAHYDDNNIIELSTKEEFLKYVGKKSYEAGSDVREFATLEQQIEGQQISAYTIKKSVILDRGAAYYASIATKLCTCAQHSGVPSENEGLNIVRLEIDGTEPTVLYYDLDPISFDEFDALSDNTDLVIRETTGKDKGTPTNNYGNQIAYNLLGLGYTVLYKRVTDLSDLASEDFYKCLEDKSSYNFRFIINAMTAGNGTANTCIISLANTRNDCVALVDIDESKYSGTYKTSGEAAVLAAIEAEAAGLISTADGKYAAAFVPKVTYVGTPDASFGNNLTFPAHYHYLACFARARQQGFAEWFASAGYTRGVADAAVVSTAYKFGEVAANTLEPRTVISVGSQDVTRSVNIIAKFRNSYLLWGNRTMALLSATEEINADHFLNIRQLLITLKKEIYTACRSLTFDPNSDTLWTNFCDVITPTLERMKGNEGIQEYEIFKVITQAKATLKAAVRIVPIEAVEDFIIEIALEDSIATISE